MVTMFTDTLPSPFYDKAVGSVAMNSTDLVTVGERIEFSQTSVTNTGFTKRAGYEKKKGEANAVLIDPANQNKVILSKPRASTPIDAVKLVKEETTPSTTNNRPSGRNRKNIIVVLPLKPLEPPYPRSYDLNAKCDCHVGGVGHAMKRCWSFKHKVQDLIDVGWLKFEENEPNMNTNPLPTHGGQSINNLSHKIGDYEGTKKIQTRLAKVAAPTLLTIQVPASPTYKDNHVVPWRYEPSTESLKDDKPTKEVTNIVGVGGMTWSGKEGRVLKRTIEDSKDAPKAKETEEFLKLIRNSEYELLEQMNKTPACISLLSLLLNSEGHRNILLKVLKEVHVAQDLMMENFGGIIGNISSKGHLTFSENEISEEGKQLNQPLHISVKCGDYMIARVLIDNGSSLNVLPKTTLDRLSSVNSQWKTSSVVVRAFDGSKR
ncbi:hypothetical protein CR513_61757, partial [Mucuna pruriens]